jgi:uncharacterized membrane protein HdeD (DUF308 family)
MIGGSDTLQPVESNVRHVGWATALRGIIAVVFGLIAIRSPNIAAGALVIVLSMYAFADAILDFVLAVGLGRAGQRWGWYVFEGLVNIALGVIALAYPGATLAVLVRLVGFRAIMLGVSEVAAAFAWEFLDSRWLLGLTGVLSILLGVLLVATPGAAGLALLWTIGVYAVVFGVMLFALGVRLLSAVHGDRHTHRPAASV